MKWFIEERPFSVEFNRLDDERGAVAYTLILGLSWVGDESGDMLNLLNPRTVVLGGGIDRGLAVH